MACRLTQTIDEIQALVTKLIDEDIIRQKALMELAVQFENASAAKSDFRKAYEKYNDITQESRALIDTFLKQESNKDYEMNLALYRNAAKIEKQIERCPGFLKPLVLAVFVLRSQELHNPQLHLGIPIS
ncbi:hypothetical protein Tco_1531692 [Tanacetum coccineum]